MNYRSTAQLSNMPHKIWPEKSRVGNNHEWHKGYFKTVINRSSRIWLVGAAKLSKRGKLNLHGFKDGEFIARSKYVTLHTNWTKKLYMADEKANPCGRSKNKSICFLPSSIPMFYGYQTRKGHRWVREMFTGSTARFTWYMHKHMFIIYVT